MGNEAKQVGEANYKLLGPGATSCNGGSLAWPTPIGDEPGAWVEVEGKIVPCKRGIHAVTAEYVIDWDGTEVWEIELGGTIIEDEGKLVASRGRLIRLVIGEWALRRYSFECAANVLPIYEAAYPDDSRVRECLRVCGDPRSSVAARDAASAAASVATSAAWAAASSAAWPTWAAARAAASAASAARATARDAASAARAACDSWAAARDAAWDAAWAAASAVWPAWAAARAAERTWQQRRMGEYLAGTVDLTAPVELPAHPTQTQETP